ncbi:hypothetical protein BJY01DRAFT_237023 [Aspergillus pseudoustus]|uniref:Fungal-specific transcription factor domain-containing protein n=1 Tax=Aspergillus pseudoustus TaxID=1810923 RepID=A0ABR4JHW9_9EURO
MRNSGTTDPAAPDFLFVDYQEDKPENRVIDKQKRVFAQKTHQRKKRQAAVERLKTSTHVFRQRLPFAYKPVADGSDVRGDDKGRRDGEDTEPATAGADVTRYFLQVTMMKEFLFPKTHLGQGFTDPFGTTAVPMNEFMDSYFHHLRNFTITQSYPLDTSRMSVWWWQRALAEPAIQLALLVSAASHQTAMNSLYNAPSQYLRRSIGEFYRLRGDTIKTLNGLLRNPGAVAESTILIVAALRAIEAIGGNIEGAAAHTNGLNALIHLHGGLEVLDHMTLSKIYHADIMCCVLTDTMPTLPLTARWRSEIRQEAKVFHSTNDLVSQLSDNPKIAAQLSALGTSFFQAPWYTGLDSTMQTFLWVSQRLIQYYEVAQLRPSVILPTDNDLFVLLEYQLVSIRYRPIRADPPTSGPLNEPLRITLFIYLNMRIWHFQHFPVMQFMVNSLRNSLVSQVALGIPAISEIKETAPDALFWVLFIGGMASHGHHGHTWFVDQLADISCYLGIQEWGAARDILSGFFYTDQPEEPGGDELWKQVVQAK